MDTLLSLVKTNPVTFLERAFETKVVFFNTQTDSHSLSKPLVPGRHELNLTSMPALLNHGLFASVLMIR